jgi:hypothetical protein
MTSSPGPTRDHLNPSPLAPALLRRAGAVLSGLSAHSAGRKTPARQVTAFHRQRSALGQEERDSTRLFPPALPGLSEGSALPYIPCDSK